MNPEEGLPKNIVLIGLMGCGKSTIGRKLQTMLGYPLVDTDQLIEDKAACSIAEIFAKRGEPYFRELESAVLHELSAPGTPRRIIATGGGVVGRKQNRKLLASLGYVVWLQAPVDVILQRTARNRDRPLLQTENPRATLSRLIQERSVLYHAAAHHTLDTTHLQQTAAVEALVTAARQAFAWNQSS